MRAISVFLLVAVLAAGAAASSKAIEGFEGMVVARTATIDHGDH